MDRRFYNSVTIYVEQSATESNCHSPSEEIPSLSWNLKVHYCAHEILPLVYILWQMNLVHALGSYLRYILISIHLCQGLPSGYFRISKQNSLHLSPPLISSAISNRSSEIQSFKSGKQTTRLDCLLLFIFGISPPLYQDYNHFTSDSDL
jgi:hypothetical protein